MEPMDDHELKELLSQWKAPAAPASLEEKVLTRPRRDSWWPWLLRGSIRVPVPAVAAILAILILSLYAAVSEPQRQAAPLAPQVSLADFRPVSQLEVRIIRSVHENR